MFWRSNFTLLPGHGFFIAARTWFFAERALRRVVIVLVCILPCPPRDPEGDAAKRADVCRHVLQPR